MFELDIWQHFQYCVIYENLDQIALTRCPVNHVYMSTSDDPCNENPATFKTSTFCPDVSSSVTVNSNERSAVMSSTCRLSAMPTPSTCSIHLPRVCALDRICTVNRYMPSTGTTGQFKSKVLSKESAKFGSTVRGWGGVEIACRKRLNSLFASYSFSPWLD